MADKAAKIAALDALASLFAEAEMAARKNAPPKLYLNAGEVRRINEAWLAGREPPWQDSDPLYRSIRWKDAVSAARKRMLACRPLPCPDGWLDLWLSVATHPQLEFVEGCIRPQKIKSVARMDRAPLRKAIRQIQATILRLEAGDEAMGRAAGAADRAKTGDKSKGADSGNRNPPVQANPADPANVVAVDPGPLAWRDGGTTYRFRKRQQVLYDLWMVLVSEKRFYTRDQLRERVSRWNGSTIDDATIDQTVKNLRKFWRKQERDDIAKKISGGRASGFDIPEN